MTTKTTQSPRPAHRALAALSSFALAALAAVPGSAETFRSSAGPIAVEQVAGPLEHPWAVAFLPDGRQLVTERQGRLLLVDGAAITPIDGVPEVRAEGQGGLLDVSAAPDFATSGEIFLTFAEKRPKGASATALARAELRFAPKPQLLDVKVLWRQEPALRSGRHFGSRIIFDPAGDDGRGVIYVTTGDRGEAERAQNLLETQGKVIRITRDGKLPQDNPFITRSDAKPEIWSWGHRNIQGADLDPETGLLWTVEHGARGGDEVNQPQPGLNYGWPEISYGRHYSGGKIGRGTEAPGMEQPEYYWDPSIAPSGLAIYDGDLFEGWKGDVLVGALKYRMLVRLGRENGKLTGEEERLFDGAFGRIRDVEIGPDGAIWFVTDEPEGGLYRAAPPPKG